MKKQALKKYGALSRVHMNAWVYVPLRFMVDESCPSQIIKPFSLEALNKDGNRAGLVQIGVNPKLPRLRFISSKSDLPLDGSLGCYTKPAPFVWVK